MEKYFRVGVITNTHGLKGEVKVFPTTDDAERYETLKEVIINPEKENIKLEIKSVRYFKNLVIVKFKGIDDINDVEKYKGKDLFVSRENAVPLEENEYYIADLIDMDVYDENDVKIGVLYDVMQTGANDVYVINMDDGRELLLPVIEETVLDVNLDEGKIKIHILDGLL